MIKHLIIGLGMVGKSFLRILIDQGYFNSASFFCIDANPDSLMTFVELGGNSEQFICVKVTENNYRNLLHSYQAGDFILDFSCEVKNTDILKYALEHNLHYISTSDSNWDMNDPKWISAHQHYLEYRRIASKRDKKAYTSIIEFGMNPGLVSCFAKECLKKIIETDKSTYINNNRKKLLKLLKKKKYGLVAKKIGLEFIIEVDHDNQYFDVTRKPDSIYSPWNPLSFFHESLSAPEMVFGTLRQFWQFMKVRDCNFCDLYISLPKCGCDCKEEVFSPQGIVSGSLITHEEVFSISHFFKYGLYKPASFFVYKPCDIAEQSVTTNRDNDNLLFRTLTRKDLKSGGESVGVILQGKRFQSAYYGNYLDSALLDETATIRQVSASTFAAYKYIQKHPCEGFKFPEELDEQEIFETVGIYLGENIFNVCNPVNPLFGKMIKKDMKV